MKRLKKSAGLKVAAIIVFATSVVAFAVSGILGLLLYNEDAFNPGGKERLRDEIIENLSWQYKQDALLYYGDYIAGGYTGEYEQEFSSKNSNFVFSIEPVDSEDKKRYGTLRNYGCSDYIYSNEEKHSISSGSMIYRSFQYPISKFDISSRAVADYIYEVEDYTEYYPIDYLYDYQEENYDEGYYEAEYYDDDNLTMANPELTTEVAVDDSDSDDVFTEEYDSGTGTSEINIDIYHRTDFYGVMNHENDENHYIIFDGKVCRLEDDWEFTNKYKQFLEALPENAAYTYEASYNLRSEKYQVIAKGGQCFDVKLTYRVRSDLSRANDVYSSSMILGYIDAAIKYVIPVFAVSFVVMLLLGGYLIAASGHRKNSDAITLNAYDRIPIDILLFIFLTGAVLVLLFFDNNINTGSSGVYFVSAAFLTWILCIYATTVGMSAATRLKAEGWSLFKNSIVYKVIRIIAKVCVIILKGIKRFGKKLWSGFKYLWTHLNLIWRIVVVAIGAGLFDIFLFCLSPELFVIAVCMELLAAGIVVCYSVINYNKIKAGIKILADGHSDYKIEYEHLQQGFREDAENLNRIGDGIILAVEERMKSERMKTELITNVSHDIKTPLTSIISYVDLLGKEELNNPKAKEYVEVIDRQAARLKKLIYDLIDASKASTGNMPMEIVKTDVRVLLEQAMGEFQESLDEKNLRVHVLYATEKTVCMADGKQLWRVFENLINNICKYSLPNSRVYINVEQQGDIIITFKNISADELNITGNELMERFVRGDSSRNTEGSGLGLSIAKSLIELMHGSMEIIVDGDLFKVVLYLPSA